MRRTILSVVALLALAVAGAAVAKEGANRSTRAVSATFSAELGENAVRTCDGADGTYRRVRGVWTGESESSEPALDGTLQIKGTAWIHTTSGNGAFKGRLRIRGEGGTVAALAGVIEKGKLEGLAHGRSSGGMRLLGNVSVTLGADGMREGKLGGGGGSNSALLVPAGPCRGESEEAEDERKADGEERKAEKEKAGKEKTGKRKARELRGSLSALGEASLTVTAAGEEPLTCSFGERAAAGLRAAGIELGAKVHVLCVETGEGFVLARLKKL